MKAKIATRLPIKKAWLDEVAALIPGITLEVVNTDKQLTATYSPYKQDTFCDFQSLRDIVNDNTVQIRAFYMPLKDLAALGAKNHLALYDNTDRDGIFDFYVGLNSVLDKRAKLNTFKSNFAWEFIHELLHGYEQNSGREYNTGDRTHDWEAKGKLKDLLALHLIAGTELQKKQIGLLQQLVASLTALLFAKKSSQSKDLLPLVKRQIDRILVDMEMLGHSMRMTQGFRSTEEQDKLYGQGRTYPGQIVTQAKGGESLHNYGVAADFVFRKEGYDAPPELWQTFGAILKKNGFEWGGSWTGGFVDMPHGEMKLEYSLKDFQNKLVDYSKYN